MTIRGGGHPKQAMVLTPVSRMGPPPRSFAADAHGCIMVRSLWTYRIQGCGASPSCPDCELPSDASSRPQRACRRARVYQGAAWKRRRGKPGQGPGEVDPLQRIAMDSRGRVFVADRGNSRVQVFDSNGKFVAEWKQFGRPSDVAIDKNDVIYVTDDQSNQNNNPGFKTGIRIGSAKDGKVTALIPTPNAEIATPEGVGFDDAGNVYGSWTGKMALWRWTKS